MSPGRSLSRTVKLEPSVERSISTPVAVAESSLHSRSISEAETAVAANWDGERSVVLAEATLVGAEGSPLSLSASTRYQ